jgi:uncharacterized membrane protein
LFYAIITLQNLRETILADIKDFISESDKNEIASTMLNADFKTSGEIRVRFERKAGRDPLAAARNAFLKLGMRENPSQNGVLFYISVFDRKFAVLGDEGINSKVGQQFWDIVRDAVITKLKEKQFAIGLIGGINMVAEKLAEFYPDEKIDLKENPDAITFEE